MNEKIKDIFSVFSAEKHFVPCTISEISSDKETLNVTAGQNANWTYANFFILPEESSIENFSINEGQYVVRKENDTWIICDYTGAPIAKGFQEIQSFVDEVNNAERTRLNSLCHIKGNAHETIEDNPRQIIWYGAPGTGKSHKIKGLVRPGNHIRTTFHPDSDYASFVGAYKPTMSEGSQRLYSKEELKSLLTQLKNNGVTYPCQKFASDYWYSLKDLSASDIKEIIDTCDFKENFYIEINKGIAIGKHNHDKGLTEKKIIYEFVAQVFLLAYVEAWKRTQRIMTDIDGNNITMPKFMDDRYYLIIEEINRGNCAQIFGDLFQLLDRDDSGESSYTIKPDQDIKRYIMEQLQGLDGLPESIRKGEELKLPSNLYLYATMNTSDQSLFPIDSAFKRRWDWEYMPITYKNTDWIIEIDKDHKYKWVEFQSEVNERIRNDTNSEDKMLGDFFVNPKNKIITRSILLNKILFYLWNDVCKDGDGDIFTINDKEEVTFSILHRDNSKLIAMMDYLQSEYSKRKPAEKKVSS